jgi:phage baseplate assembly protein gpV
MNYDRLHQVSWTHPRKGEQVEILCSQHEHEVLDALRVLNIGATGTTADESRTKCHRCALRGSRFVARQP